MSDEYPVKNHDMTLMTLMMRMIDSGEDVEYLYNQLLIPSSREVIDDYRSKGSGYKFMHRFDNE